MTSERKKYGNPMILAFELNDFMKIGFCLSEMFRISFYETLSSFDSVNNWYCFKRRKIQKNKILMIRMLNLFCVFFYLDLVWNSIKWKNNLIKMKIRVESIESLTFTLCSIKKRAILCCVTVSHVVLSNVQENGSVCMAK